MKLPPQYMYASVHYSLVSLGPWIATKPRLLRTYESLSVSLQQYKYHHTTQVRHNFPHGSSDASPTPTTRYASCGRCCDVFSLVSFVSMLFPFEVPKGLKIIFLVVGKQSVGGVVAQLVPHTVYFSPLNIGICANSYQVVSFQTLEARRRHTPGTEPL